MTNLHFQKALEHDEDPSSEHERQVAFYRLDEALASGDRQVGPDVHLCAILLGCDESPPDNQGRLPTSLLDRLIALYPWQINGIVALFLKLFGAVPLGSKKASFVTHARKPEVIHALEALTDLPWFKDGETESATELSLENYKSISQSIATHGAFLADQTGMGKKILISFFISWLFEHGVTPKGLSKPTLIVFPALLVERWAKEIMTKFRNLKVGVLYPDAHKIETLELANKGIQFRLTRHLPSLKGCPHWLKPAWETQNESNPWVIVASIDTLTSRIVSMVPDKAKSRMMENFIDSNGEEQERWVRPMKWASNMARMFDLVVMEEGYKYRNTKTQAWWSIKGLSAIYHIILSAILMISSVSVSMEESASPTYN